MPRWSNGVHFKITIKGWIVCTANGLWEWPGLAEQYLITWLRPNYTNASGMRDTSRPRPTISLAQAQNTCLNCWPSTPLLHSFVLLQIRDYWEFLHSKQRQTDKNVFLFFLFQAATVWTNLPQTVRYCTHISSFKSSLKTHLFSK